MTSSGCQSRARTITPQKDNPAPARPGTRSADTPLGHCQCPGPGSVRHRDRKKISWQSWLYLVFNSLVLGLQKDHRLNWTRLKKDWTAVAVQALWWSVHISKPTFYLKWLTVTWVSEIRHSSQISQVRPSAQVVSGIRYSSHSDTQMLKSLSHSM